jgi:ClpP class serine protease
MSTPKAYSSNPKYSNSYIEQLITSGKWVIEPEMGKLALGKYIHDLELLNSGGASLRDLYGKSKRENTPTNDEFENQPFYNDFTIIINEKGELTPIASNWYLENEEDKPVDKVIRVISFRGVMMKRGGLSTKAIADVCQELDEAYDADNINGVVLEMDTGGGAVQAAEMLGDKIKQKNKPVVIAATNIFSGGAWGTAYADHIIGIGKTAGFGSIGVMGEITNDKEYWENKGYKVHRFYASQSTDKNRSYEEAIQGKYNYYRTTQLDPLCELFLSEMKSGRPVSLEDKSWQTGRTFMTEEAIKIGLCDSQGSLQDAILKCQELANSSSNRSGNSKTNAINIMKANANKNNNAGSLEIQLQELHQSYMNVLSANVETGKEGLEQQRQANINLRDEYAKTYAAVKLMDKEMTDLKHRLANSTNN